MKRRNLNAFRGVFYFPGRWLYDRDRSAVTA
jgi:hypothetical protein